MDLTSTTVYLQKCPRYDEAHVMDVFGQLIPLALGGKDLHSLRVLIKPNLITARMGKLACTDARFIVAAAKWFLDKLK